MSNKTKLILKLVLGTAILSFVLVGGITFRQRRINVQKIDETPVVMIGVPQNLQGGLRKELKRAFKQVSYLDKGDTLLREGKIDEAIKQYEIAFSEGRSQGSKGVALVALANAYEKKRDYKKALELVIIDRDQYVNDWAKAPVVERVKYLGYALKGEYDLVIEYAQKALEADSKLPNRPKEGRSDYVERLNDLRIAKEYILSLKKKQ